MNDDRLKPLIDSNFETEVANFLQHYGIDDLDIETFRKLRDAKFNAVGSLWPEIVALASIAVEHLTSGSLCNEIKKFKGHLFHIAYQILGVFQIFQRPSLCVSL